MFSFRGPPLREPSPIDLEVARFSRELCAAEEPGRSVEDLRSLVAKVGPILEEMVLDNRRDHLLFSRDPSNVLRSYFICGPANDSLGFLVSKAGFDVRNVTITSLSPDYPCPDHRYLLVDCGEPVILDAAYTQFLKCLGGSAVQKAAPGEILLLPYSELEERCAYWASLADEQEGLRVIGFAHGGPARRLELSASDRADYFRKVWDFASPGHVLGPENGYASSIASFREKLEGKELRLPDEDRIYLRMLARRGLMD